MSEQEKYSIGEIQDIIAILDILYDQISADGSVSGSPLLSRDFYESFRPIVESDLDKAIYEQLGFASGANIYECGRPYAPDEILLALQFLEKRGIATRRRLNAIVDKPALNKLLNDLHDEFG